MDGETINPVPPTPFDPTPAPAIGPGGDSDFVLSPEDIPNVDDVVIEDGQPVENIVAEKQYRLLTEPLYSSWAPTSGPFLALANVGLYPALGQPPLVPDVMLAVNVRTTLDFSRKDNRSYFVWIIGKFPDVVIEFVSDRRWGEEDYKKDEYARIGVPYYVIFDPLDRLKGGILRAFALRDKAYRSRKPSWLSGVGLGLMLWEGSYEGHHDRWLRWCDHDGVPIPTGRERAEQEKQRAEQEKQRAERLAAQLRALGIEPDA